NLLTRLAKAGIPSVIVENPSPNTIILCFARLNGALLAAMSRTVRSNVVLVDEGRSLNATTADETRKSLGLLGLIESSAWSKWKRGMFVAWGLFGREDVALRGGLTFHTAIGLQPPSDRAELCDALTRFLVAAEPAS
ncbi:MAG: hypothetical protein ABJE66_36415, partial [Deltaproteobacteria bacterium]